MLEPLVSEKAAQEVTAQALTALGHASDQQGDHLKAVEFLSQLHRIAQTDAPRVFARQTLSRLIDRSLSLAQVRALYKKPPCTPPSAKPLVCALAARRLILGAAAQGDQTTARKLKTACKSLLEENQVALSAKRQSPRIGLLLPLSGPYRTVGKLAFRGALTGARVLSGGPQNDADADTLMLVDDSSSGAAATAERLINEKKVVAILGTLNPATTRRVAQVAARHKVPFLSFAAVAPFATDESVLRMLPSNERRAKSLARFALSAFAPNKSSRPRLQAALLYPQSRYGQQLARTFAAVVEAARGKIVARQDYPPRTTAFAAPAKVLARSSCNAVFVADSARVVALVAPALALAGIWPSAPGHKPPRGRAIQLLATGDGLAGSLLSRAGRYVQGAVFAPGFFADETAPGAGDLVRLYRQKNNAPPGLIEAFAFDAVAAAYAHLARGVSTASQLRQALEQKQTPYQGLTGTVRFDPQGNRLDRPRLYRVNGNRIQQLRFRRQNPRQRLAPKEKP